MSNRYKKWSIKTLQEMKQNPNHHLHGTVKGYRIGCGCDKCRSLAVYKQIDDDNKNRKERAQGYDPALSPHGTRARYQYGCRCKACRQANALYVRHRRG